MSNLNHLRSFILACLRDGSLSRTEIIKFYDQMSQVMGPSIHFSGTDRGRSFSGRLVHYLRELSELKEVDLVRLEGERITLTWRGKSLSARRVRRAKFGIPV